MFLRAGYDFLEGDSDEDRSGAPRGAPSVTVHHVLRRDSSLLCPPGPPCLSVAPWQHRDLVPLARALPRRLGQIPGTGIEPPSQSSQCSRKRKHTTCHCVTFGAFSVFNHIHISPPGCGREEISASGSLCFPFLTRSCAWVLVSCGGGVCA